MINISAILQIAILYVVIHAILKTAKGSRFGQVLMGVGIIAGTMVAITFLFNFDVLSRIIHFLLAYLAISTVVIFQPEIRRFLSSVGAFGFFDRPKTGSDSSASPEYITDTIIALAEQKIGALIAFERGISLRGYEDTGIITNAVFTRELATCIFTPPMPLHDGGMTIRGGRISAAHCVFPVSHMTSLTSRGMRHRAAVGLSEETDALVIVVSEETGSISVAHNGKLFRYDGAGRKASILKWITKAVRPRRRNALLAGILSYIMKGSGR